MSNTTLSDNQKQYLEYLERMTRCNEKTIQSANEELVAKLVGQSYGLSEKEMDEVGE